MHLEEAGITAVIPHPASTEEEQTIIDPTTVALAVDAGTPSPTVLVQLGTDAEARLGLDPSRRLHRVGRW